MSEDWLDQLKKIKDLTPCADDEPAQPPKPGTRHTPQKERLDIIVERKGRGGKTATIITGFTCDDAEVTEVAARLKQQLGTGGSARGGEILIQGERARDVLARLTTMGYKARII